MSMTISRLRLVEGQHDQSRRSNHRGATPPQSCHGSVGRNELGSSASGLLSLQGFFLVLQNERPSGIGGDLASVSSSDRKNRFRPLVMSRRRKQRPHSRC